MPSRGQYASPASTRLLSKKVPIKCNVCEAGMTCISTTKMLTRKSCWPHLNDGQGRASEVVGRHEAALGRFLPLLSVGAHRRERRVEEHAEGAVSPENHQSPRLQERCEKQRRTRSCRAAPDELGRSRPSGPRTPLPRARRTTPARRARRSTRRASSRSRRAATLLVEAEAGS